MSNVCVNAFILHLFIARMGCLGGSVARRVLRNYLSYYIYPHVYTSIYILE